MTILKSLIIACALLLGAPALSANDENTGSGTVAETMTSGGYVYVRLEEDNTWVAARPVPVAVGDKVRYAGGAVMKDFHSRTLDRSFDSILFTGELEVISQITADVHTAAAARNLFGIEKSATVTTPELGKVIPLEGGQTIAGIFADSAQLKEQTVSLRARVVKVSKNILGKNWITLQDGTGTEPDNKLRATSLELVEPGDIVIAKGIVRTDIDIGAGYKYKVLLEEATFSPGLE